MAGDESNYKVSPGSPPLHTRLRKGQSGNPGGRSRKSLMLKCIQMIHRGIALLVFPGVGRDPFAP